MKQGISFRSWMTLGVLAMVFSGSAADDTVPAPLPRHYPDTAQEQSNAPFIEPIGLQDAVQFWRQVFGVWRLNQFALHDNVHLGVVYDVIELPDAEGEGLTPEHRASVEKQVRALEDELRELEDRVRLGAGLSDIQKRLLDLLTTHAGEDAVYGASTRVRSQRGLRERFLKGLEVSGRYDRLFRQVFREADLPEDLAYLPHVESSFVNHVHSSAGAAGMWQFMRATARHCLHVSRAVDERFDPVFAARGAARYLAHAYEVLGDWGLAITSYNHGVTGMARAKNQFGADFVRIVRHYQGPTFGFASRNFYTEFLAVRSIVQNLTAYFPEGVAFHTPLNHDLVRLTSALPVSHLARMHDLDRDTIAELNPAWTSAAIKGRTLLPAGIDVWLPHGVLARASGASAYVQPVILAGDDSLHDPSLQSGKINGRIVTAGLIDVSDDSVDLRSHLFVAQAPISAEDIVEAPGPRKAVAQKTNRKSKHQLKRKVRLHVVRHGESPHLIATKYGVRLRKLLMLNAITQRTVLRPGQRLRIPI
ncbi:lytic transglycosylase domain-containing protein [Methylocaldum sp.]|uniref:lytic transglycosylase domain-containing protein n=1 Tax=Methylocaldum sp. TaxID=1969727 RepID=UPI002D3D7EF1|nr:transglycosylase SLT domain-containing protein [Methylocaldum sp.]HYE34119.1 transglycosylase SLT domain-containing protein [Methylocaldum sp.]